MLPLLLAFAAIVPAGQPFSCRVAWIDDGDTLICASRVKVRLRAVDAPELPGHCRAGRHCAPGDPFASRRALIGMAKGRTLSCVADGSSYDRTAAWCSAPAVGDLSCAMWRGGWAIREERYDPDHQLCHRP